MRPYDEGLYGKLARNALLHDTYLHAVDPSGELYPDFTKPPLTIVLVAASFRWLGVSLAALRLPFALSMLGLVLVAFAWGRRIAGLPMAVAWSGTLLLVAACVRWGRVACIEPMLMLWVLLGLWAYHEALLREGRSARRWAALCGVALALALLTKQLVVGIAVAPILGLELWRRDGRAALPRLGLALGIPTAVGGTWLGLMLQRNGQATLDVLLHTGIVRRVSGFASGHSARSLNELAGIVAEACEPFAWVAGVAGLVLLVLARPPARRSADGALLLPLLLVVGVLLYDTVSQSLLPWYAFDLVVPLTAGMGFAIAGLVSRGPGTMGTARTALGALTLAMAAVGALASVASQLGAAVLAAAAVLGLLRLDPEQHAGWRRRATLGLLGAAALALLVGELRRPERRSTAGGHERFMQHFAAHGIERVYVDLDTRIAGEHAWGTYYGPHARWQDRPPWRAGDSKAQAYVTATIWPRELRTLDGSQVLRGPGLMALVGGDLGRPPWSSRTLDELLAAGPLTFEAEDLPSQRDDVLVEDPEASGGMARAMVPYRSESNDAFLLTHGPGLRLPAGSYRVELWLRWGCGAVVERPAVVVQVAAGHTNLLKQELACREGAPGPYEPTTFDVHLVRPSRLELRVQYLFGEVWVDRFVMRRR